MSWRKLPDARTRAAAACTLVTVALTATACSGETESAGHANVSPTTSAAETRSPSPSAEPARTKGSPPVSSRRPDATTGSAGPRRSTRSTKSTQSTQSPTEAESTEAPTAAPAQPPAPGSGPKAMLLTGDEMPGLNDQHRWRPVSTENKERREPVWSCQVTDFFSIGATDVWVRRFVGKPGGAASAQARSAVITFADAQSAQRGYSVLQSWHDRCEKQLKPKYRRVHVAATPTTVDVDGGSAQWRLATYGPVKGDPDSQFFDATGYVRDGRRISLTTMVNVGQDYNYPQGKEPIVGAIQNSAVKLRG